MNKFNMSLAAGGIFGFVSIALGAYTAHKLRNFVSAEDYGYLEEALHYQLMHAVVLAAIGLAQFLPLPVVVARRLSLASLFFGFGIVCFSGGIYIGILGRPEAMQLAPVGGFAFMLGWLSLICVGFSNNR